MSSKDVEKEIYTTFSDIASAIGYSEMHGRIIAALLVAGKRTSLQELANLTGYSPSTISLSLDLLEFLGMVKKMKNVGDRKLYIELQGDLLGGLKKAFLIRIQKSIDNTLEKFDRYKDILDKAQDGDREKVIRTLSVLEKEVRRVDKYVSLLAKLKLP